MRNLEEIFARENRKRKLSRREFVKTAGILAGAAAASSLFPRRLRAEPSPPPRETFDLLVVEGSDYPRLIETALKEFGFPKTMLTPGGTVVIKPNAAWSRTPEQAANTNPVLLTALIKACRKAEASRIAVAEHPCDNYKSAFRINGIREAVEDAGAEMIPLAEDDQFREVSIPRGKVLKKAAVGKPILEADFYVNFPIAKVHGAAKLTMAMKNHMGAVQDRWFFHRNDLNQCIADISSYLRPDLTILDCTRILTTNGPKGPGEVKTLNRIVVGFDQAAIDSYGTTLFGMKPDDLAYLRAAGEMGLGKTDLSRIRVKEIAVS
ncbi:MAG: DUF362 domain-containing protein [Candidatus Erginobacter occultus]|nr:DUF362 domain-containing protein [Candidatus Erginobacter occultus]